MSNQEEFPFFSTELDLFKDVEFPFWRLENRNLNVFRLYKCSDEFYRTIVQGRLPVILESPLFVIVNEQLKLFLEKFVPDQIQFTAISIYDRPTDANIDGFYKVADAVWVTLDNISSMNHSGDKVWIVADYGFLFVSQELKNKMEHAELPGLFYSPGFSLIGGK